MAEVNISCNRSRNMDICHSGTPQRSCPFSELVPYCMGSTMLIFGILTGVYKGWSFGKHRLNKKRKRDEEKTVKKSTMFNMKGILILVAFGVWVNLMIGIKEHFGTLKEALMSFAGNTAMVITVTYILLSY